ncbi:antitoxin VbhA family protein [Dyella halodurans]
MRDEGGYVGLDDQDNLVRTLPGGGLDVIEISDAERQRRQEYFNCAVATAELEGLKVDDATKDRARRYIAGEISLAELVALKHE